MNSAPFKKSNSRSRWFAPLFGIILALALATDTAAQTSTAQASPDAAPGQIFRIVYDRAGTLFPLAMDAPIYNNIYTVLSDGSGERQLTHDNNSLHPVLSPDGAKIAFVHIKANSCEGCLWPPEYEIGVMNADGTDAHFVADLPARAAEIRWAPDRKSFAFRGGLFELSLQAAFFPESPIYLVQLDGESSSVFLVQKVEGTFEWSPDGRWIAYGCPDLQTKSPARRRLCLAEASRQENPKFVLEGAIPLGYAWSPDGGRLAYVAAGKKTSTIFVVGIDGSSPIALTDAQAVVPELQWSPDGKEIAFSDLEKGKRGVFLINADGSGRRRLTGPKLNASQPMWSSDGKQIVFIGIVHDRPQVHLMNADGSGLRAITHDKKLACLNLTWLGKSRLVLLRCGNGYDVMDPSLPWTPQTVPMSNGNLFVVAVDDPVGKLLQLTKAGLVRFSVAPIKFTPATAAKPAP